MLGIKKALESFKALPSDPYVMLPDSNIELRFDKEGRIIAAYNADEKPAIRWYSEEFRTMLTKAPIGEL